MTHAARTTAFAAYLVAQLLVVALLCNSVQARQPDAPLVNPSKISFDHDGENVTGFVAYVSAEGLPSLRIDLGRAGQDKKTKRFVASLPPLPPGTYTLEIAAYNAAGESPRVQADPPRFQITEAASANRDRQTTKAAESPARPPEPQKTEEQPKEKRGIFGRIYRGIVGSDEEEQ